MPTTKHMVRQYPGKAGKMEIDKPGEPPVVRKNMMMKPMRKSTNRVRQFGRGQR